VTVRVWSPRGGRGSQRPFRVGAWLPALPDRAKSLPVRACRETAGTRLVRSRLLPPPSARRSADHNGAGGAAHDGLSRCRALVRGSGPAVERALRSPRWCARCCAIAPCTTPPTRPGRSSPHSLKRREAIASGRCGRSPPFRRWYEETPVDKRRCPLLTLSRHGLPRPTSVMLRAVTKQEMDGAQRSEAPRWSEQKRTQLRRMPYVILFALCGGVRASECGLRIRSTCRPACRLRRRTGRAASPQSGNCPSPPSWSS